MFQILKGIIGHMMREESDDVLLFQILKGIIGRPDAGDDGTKATRCFKS